jgi:hypothetical protein
MSIPFRCHQYSLSVWNPGRKWPPEHKAPRHESRRFQFHPTPRHLLVLIKAASLPDYETALAVKITVPHSLAFEIYHTRATTGHWSYEEQIFYFFFRLERVCVSLRYSEKM